MKIQIFIQICLIQLLLISIGHSAEVSFDVENVALNDKNSQFSGSEIEYYQISDSLSLPFKTIYLKTVDSLSFSDLKIEITQLTSKSTKYDFSPNSTPTSVEPTLYQHIKSSTELDSIGFKPVIYQGVFSANDQTYIRLQLFPITVNQEHQLVSSSLFQFNSNNQQLAQSSLLSAHDFKTLTKYQKDDLSSQASSDYPIYMIITNAYLTDSFEPLASYKNQTGIRTEIKNIEEILGSYSGRDNAEKLRNYLKEFYSNNGLYVLFGGDETVIPIRHAYHNVAYTEISIEDQQVSDLYFADLTGDWNADHDNVWGEKYSDSVDLTPELYIGRLPFNQPNEVTNYISKLIDYETNRKNVNLDYLEDVFIFSSDQMRDYNTDGQHKLISEAFPSNFQVDTINGIEQSNGIDLNPTNLSSPNLESVLSSGYGVVNIIAHGSNSTFAVKTSGYNDWPKSYFTTDSTFYGHGNFYNLENNNKISFYASLGCDNGAFDKDQPPFNQTNPNLVQTLLSLQDKGAVGFIANSRWGWVSTSHLLQRRFFEHIIANPELPAIDAMHKMKEDYYYYRDLVMGSNYFGDPTMKIYTSVPKPIDFSVNHEKSTLSLIVSSNGQPLDSVHIIISSNNQINADYFTNSGTPISIEYDFELGTTYIISAVKHGYTIKQIEYTPSIVTDITTNELNLPTEFSLYQNYPNPFNPSTTIEFSLPTSGFVTLAVYNLLGQKTAIITEKHLSAGFHSLEWNGKNERNINVASGIYFYRLEHEEFTAMKKMLLLR